MDASPAMCVDLSKGFLDHFFPQELREEKEEKFVNLKQERMSV